MERVIKHLEKVGMLPELIDLCAKGGLTEDVVESKLGALMVKDWDLETVWFSTIHELGKRQLITAIEQKAVEQEAPESEQILQALKRIEKLLTNQIDDGK